MTSRLLYTIIFGFGAGVLIRSYIQVAPVWLIVFLSTSFLLIIVSLFFNKWKEISLTLSLSVIALMFGVIRVHLSDMQIEKPFEEIIGEKTNFTGTIIDEVENRESNQRFVLEESKTEAKILVTTDLFPKYAYGDVVEISGTLKTPENFTTDQGKEFDYVSYLGKDSIFYTMSFAHVEKIGHDVPSRFQEILFSFKGNLVGNIEEVMPRPESTFMQGIALGGRSGMPADMRKDFVTTGTIHIIALSGYNITVVADGVQKFFSLFLSRYVSLGAGAFAVILFVLMTGAQATAVRAGIMALLAVIARATGRDNDISRALFLAGFLMVVHNPLILAHDVSFQLSFIATLGLIHLTPITELWFTFLKKWKFAWLREVIATTLAAQIAVLPFIVYTMGTLSLISFPLNILILPFIPFAMYLGFIVGMFGFLGSWLSMPFGYLGTKLLEAILSLIEKSADVPFAQIEISHFPLALLIILYGLLVWAVIRWKKRHILRIS